MGGRIETWHLGSRRESSMRSNCDIRGHSWGKGAWSRTSILRPPAPTSPERQGGVCVDNCRLTPSHATFLDRSKDHDQVR